ncbi:MULTISPECIES: bifunctional 2-polyprenyl-6-hydroxyphenol methylase/3-demethylubiquinol 3-O-methyltransferase UbiG [Thalassospira]|uniref:Methyltransferase domain-containing protein n=1 Tax=Thalassospira profundimaris TaxID=502049 RepID=A0A367VJT1_9PROT|nr:MULTISPECIES: class I SAM-dependent methyltransferase [Thalassospira]KZB70941.1 hypothetical protein AUQ43_08835 [Thalassospira sp. MCCC 1A01148]MBR9899338.1 class I SAM-dependent methyltransferase [Rhodospirillales bacterium]RCK25416.1 hypothetical protein TH6_02020 [Thalassospira profundimaris]
MSTRDIYARWNEDECVNIFAQKSPADFFETEKKFLRPIASRLERVLDVGCATGRFLELLKSLGFSGDYSGIDISEKNIHLARENYPENEFFFGNASDFDFNEEFDIVNATGVFQHDPNFEGLLNMMLSASRKYVLFDVKFADISEHVIDIEKSRAGSKENPLFFCIFSIERFISDLCSFENIKTIEFFGYETKKNKNTKIPNNIDSIYSSGVFIEKCAPGEHSQCLVTGVVEGLVNLSGVE